MKNKKITVLFVFLFCLTILWGVNLIAKVAGDDAKKTSAREKKVKIGKTEWYTEQNRFSEIVEIAKKEDKPFVVVFSATWCGPCQRVKHDVFSKDEFQEMSKKALLLYIEQTQPAAKEWIQKYKVTQYPTFMIFSKNGEQLNTGSPGFPERTIPGFFNWVEKVKSGKGLEPRGKTFKLGKTTWYTEENSINEMLALAKNNNKPLLMLFGSEKSKTMQRFNQMVFEKDSFQVMENKAILYFIEQYRPKGMELFRQYKIRFGPSVILFSANGDEIEDEFPFVKSTEDFIKWFDETISGQGYYLLSQKLKTEPNNRELMLKIARKLTRKFQKRHEMLKLLDKVIELNPNFSDPITQEAWEVWIPAIYSTSFSISPDSMKKDFLLSKWNEIQNVYTYYYPDKFKFDLKHGAGRFYMILWLNILGRYDQSLKYFEDLLKENDGQPDLKKESSVIKEAMNALLHSGREKEAQQWLAKIEDYLKEIAKNLPEEKKKIVTFEAMASHYYEIFAKYYNEKGKTKEVEYYARKIIENKSKIGSQRQQSYMTLKYCQEFGIFFEKAKKILDELYTVSDSKEYKMKSLLMNACELAKLYAAMGKLDEAHHAIKEVLDKVAPDDPMRSNYLNQAAWTLYELELVDQTTLDYTLESVKKKPSAENLDTLACVYATLGDYKKAIENEELAIKATEDLRNIQIFKEKIDIWRFKLSQ